MQTGTLDMSIPTQPRVPEILAPAGGREQFFAALNSGADAVYLGLQQFNARARATNFSIDDLRELLPLAHRHGMKVLVTLNILIKQSEIPELLRTVGEIEALGVHAVIVQDLGVVRMIRKYFPNLRIHASTQMAVHNSAGVLAAQKLGIKRVVLAREITATELRRMRTVLSGHENPIEIEVFCHGSLCYSYSGLCFFSGVGDRRSGNRGECAYTCRKPYKILNEPGHGFLFSMGDLDTSESLDKLVEAGVDTLKIEGRKKDAQYVTSVVRLYRKKLDDFFGYPTLRASAPKSHVADASLDEIRADLQFSYQRRSTSFFTNGRYHENVIDLDNPSHLGVAIGRVEEVRDGWVSVRIKSDLRKFDGIRISPRRLAYHSTPQHGDSMVTPTDRMKKRYENQDIEFSVRGLTRKGQNVFNASANERVRIQVPHETKVSIGDSVYKIRSADLRERVEKISKAPTDARLRDLSPLFLTINVQQSNRKILIEAQRPTGEAIRYQMTDVEIAPSDNSIQPIVDKHFGIFGNAGYYSAEIKIAGDIYSFLPMSLWKRAKRELSDLLPTERVSRHVQLNEGCQPWQPTQDESCFHLKIDRLDYLDALQRTEYPFSSIVFEPKRAYLGSSSPEEVCDQLIAFAQVKHCQIRLALPTVIRAWDEPLTRRWFQAAFQRGMTDVELGNLGGFEYLRQWNLTPSSITTDFSAYSLNAIAANEWGELGASVATLSIEDDLENIRASLSAWPMNVVPQAILYKDSPLFIAEACSLTALHGGCPGSNVCGYRSLEIEDPEGERYTVAHEACRSIVYGHKAYSISEYRKDLESLGIRDFRIDFCTKKYSAESIVKILEQAAAFLPIPQTHPANFLTTLK